MAKSNDSSIVSKILVIVGVIAAFFAARFSLMRASDAHNSLPNPNNQPLPYRDPDAQRAHWHKPIPVQPEQRIRDTEMLSGQFHRLGEVVKSLGDKFGRKASESSGSDSESGIPPLKDVSNQGSRASSEHHASNDDWKLVSSEFKPTTVTGEKVKLVESTFTPFAKRTPRVAPTAAVKSATTAQPAADVRLASSEFKSTTASGQNVRHVESTFTPAAKRATTTTAGPAAATASTTAQPAANVRLAGSEFKATTASGQNVRLVESTFTPKKKG